MNPEEKKIIEVTAYFPINKGVLQGSFNIKVLRWGGFCIDNLTFFIKEDRKWVNFPTRFLKEEDKYVPLLKFSDSNVEKVFKEHVVKAVEEYLLLHPPTSSLQKELDFGEVPF